jgi:lipopolysaccharide/colanic/teichoic acid biosynthesis glycosyltransferase
MEQSSAMPRTSQPPIPVEAEILNSLPLSSPEPPRLRAVQNHIASHLASERAPDGLPLNQFLNDLHREMRRADRSRTPLSLLVYRFERAAPQGVRPADHLLELLHRVKRETDIVGVMDGDKVAVLCPDTDEAGTRAFLRKIVDAHGGNVPIAAAPAIATYPHVMFDSLASGNDPLPTARPFVVSDNGVLGESGYAGKRALDIVGAVTLILLFAPLMLLIALAIVCGSRGPVIFRQKRLGKGGKPFTFYKFRSMKTLADDSIHRAYVAKLISGKLAGDERGPSKTPFKLESDPRVTWIGRLIRKSSIDELPQLFNVLKGEMSLVGPRPPIPYEAAHYQSWHLRRTLSLMPGITGVWQVEGRSRVSFDEMVRMDLRYLRDCSFGLDLRILLRTVLVVVRCEGAA